LNSPTQTETAATTVVTHPVLYPNPVTGEQVTLTLPSVSGQVTVEIFTLSFRELQTIKVQENGDGFLVIPLLDREGNRLANGLYYLRVSGGGQKWTLKLLVLK
jgi:hypothetical protein